MNRKGADWLTTKHIVDEGSGKATPAMGPLSLTEASMVGADALGVNKSPVHTLLRNVLARALELGNAGCHTLGVEPVYPDQK